MSDEHVIVAGGGPVGLLTAFGLAARGVPVTVVERDEQIGTAPRAIVYWFCTLDGFEQLGLLEELEEAGTPLEGLHFIDVKGGRRTTLTTDVLEGLVKHPYQLSLGQDKLTAILLRRLQEHPHARVLSGVSVTDLDQDDRGVRVTVSGAGGEQVLTGSWLVGADGANSFVRRHLELGFDGHTWPDTLVATNIRFDFEPYYGTGGFVIDPEHGAIVVKIEEGLWRCTFRDEPGADLAEDALRARIEKWFAEALPGEDRSYVLEAFSPYRIHQRCASSFRSGRVLLAGDAAHITNPIGGLGLTSGLLDSFVLSEALAAVVNGEEREEVLDLYAAERRTAFLDHVSPAACENKAMVYDLADPAMREQILAGIWAMTADPELSRAQLFGVARIATPSVVGRPPVPPRPRTERGSFWVCGAPEATPHGTVQRGQMYVEWERPEGEAGVPVVLVHGGGGQGTDFLTTPDGRPGWAPLLVDRGHPVYVVDRPGHGRSPHSVDVLGPMTPVMGSEALRDLFLNPTEGPRAHPTAIFGNQWPGGSTVGDPVWDQFLASQGPLMADSAGAQQLAADALVALLERIGPAVVVTHSLGGPAGYLAADARPDLVRALIAVEAIGPQFMKAPELGLDLAWGVTSAPVTFDPPVDDPTQLALTVDTSGPFPFPLTLQEEPARRLPRLAQVPIALVSGEASGFRWFDEHVRAFLTQAGCTVELVRLWEHGVRGNGHGMMLELNNAASADVLAGWIARQLGSDEVSR